MLHSSQKIVAAFRSSGRRMTRQRQAIIQCLAGRDDHPSARQIFSDVKAGKSESSLATVYNTLATLVELGFLAEIEFEDEDNRYDTNVSPHVNLVCDACGTITDFDREPPVSAFEIQTSLGFMTTGIRMEYHGVCASCSSKDQSPESEEP